MSEEQYWWCPECKHEKPPLKVTFEENCADCGTRVVSKQSSPVPGDEAAARVAADKLFDMTNENGEHVQKYYDKNVGYILSAISTVAGPLREEIKRLNRDDDESRKLCTDLCRRLGNAQAERRS